MSERGMPIADGAHACPFVAFDDDRDERATVPDHRHRCYAEVRPAPRALAHQEAYCLSSAFPVCPTFQDWARRESARARDAATAAADASAADAADAGDAGPSVPEPVVPVVPAAPPPMPPLPDLSPERADDAVAGDEAAAAAAAAAAEARNGADDEPRRNPPRDWSAPPPWLASSEAAARGGPSEPPDFLSRRTDPAQGLAGSAADQLAGGPAPRPTQPPPAVPPRDRPAPGDVDAHDGDDDLQDRDLPRPAVPPRRPRAYDQHLGGPSSGPDWERPRRYEAYPTIKTRMGMPQIPRLGVTAAAIVVAALALFFLPAILGLGSGQGTNSSPSPTARPSRSIAPTPTPAPTAQIYTIKKGDTLSKIATAFGITLEELRAANPAIKDPNKIVEGQQITIPPPVSQVPNEFGGSPSAAP